MRPRDWLKLADRDLCAAKMFKEEALDPENYIAVQHRQIYLYFYTQQAIEKSMKGLLESKITVPETHDIGVLLHLCEKNGINGLPKLSDTTLDIISSWEDTCDFKKEDEQTYMQALELQSAVHEQLRQSVVSTETAMDRLVDKLNYGYAVMREHWWDMTADELIENAEKITAAKFIKANAESCITDEAAEYLLQFKNPLEALMDSLAYRYDPLNIAERETFSDMVYDLCDKHDFNGDFETEDEGMNMS